MAARRTACAACAAPPTRQRRPEPPIPFEEIAHIEDRAELVMELRKRTFGLAQPGDIKGASADLHLREARIKGVKHKAED